MWATNLHVSFPQHNFSFCKMAAVSHVEPVWRVQTSLLLTNSLLEYWTASPACLTRIEILVQANSYRFYTICVCVGCGHEFTGWDQVKPRSKVKFRRRKINLVTVVTKAETLHVLFHVAFSKPRSQMDGPPVSSHSFPIAPQRLLFLLLFPLRAGLEKSSRKTGSQITRRSSEHSFLLEQITLFFNGAFIPSDTNCSRFYFRFTLRWYTYIKSMIGYFVDARSSKYQSQASFGSIIRRCNHENISDIEI